MTLFSTQEMLDLISEVGQLIEFCVPGTVRPADPALALPAKTDWVCRTVPGYLRQSHFAGIAIANSAQSAQGDEGLIAVLSANQITAQELNNANARIRYERGYYQFTYLKGILDRGKLQLHEIQLVSTKATIATP